MEKISIKDVIKMSRWFESIMMILVVLMGLALVVVTIRTGRPAQIIYALAILYLVLCIFIGSAVFLVHKLRTTLEDLVKDCS